MDTEVHEILDSSSDPGDQSPIPENQSPVSWSFDDKITFQDKPKVWDRNLNNDIVLIVDVGDGHSKLGKMDTGAHEMSESASGPGDPRSIPTNSSPISWSNETIGDEIAFQDESDVWGTLSVASSQKSERVVLPDVSDTSDETREANNNDSSSGMDSNNFVDEETLALMRECLEPCGSPKPSCSKRWRSRDQNEKRLPLRGTYETNERVRHIFGLVSKVTRESILDAVKIKHNAPVSELKLWDLLPANERVEYQFVRTLTDQFFGTAKRGPKEDICTVEYKRSSSNRDRSNVSPGTPHSSETKINSPSGIAQGPDNSPLVIDDWNVHVPPKQFDDPNVQSSPGSPDVKIVEVINAKPIIRSTVLEARVQGRKRLMPPAHKSNRNTEEPVTYCRGLPVSLVVHDNALVQVMPAHILPRPVNSTTTNEQHPVKNIPKLSIAEQLCNSQQTSSSIAKESQPQTQTYVQRSVAQNVSSYDPKKNVRLTSPNDPPRNNHQTQGEMPPSTNRLFCIDMYYRLRNIFPNVDPNYIMKICPPEWGPDDREAQLIPLVEHLLKQADHQPAIAVETKFENDPVETCEDVDGMYETLLGIFPDADPHYLREFAAKNVGKPNALTEFVENKLQSHDYPTREQYMTRLKITEQQRQYTTGFDVKQFLTIIPEPFKHFMDPKRKCSYNIVMFEFLKSYFNKIRVQTISSIYARSEYNTSITAAKLAGMECDLKARRICYEMPTEDIVLLQEIAFVKHKNELSYCVLKEKTLEETEFRMLKQQNGLVECQCCFDSECVPSKCSNCDNGHRFCNSCVKMGTSSKMGDGETRISCFLNCGSEFSLSTLQKVLAPTTFSILLKKRQAAEVIEAGIEGLVSCPFCHFASIPPEEDKVFKCLNPECTKESCRLCKELSHVPLRCDEVMKADKARHYIEEKMTQALARECYKCHRPFFKEEGCNKITCPCGAFMCYLCDKPLENKDYSHFRGQGSEDKKLCPLYSDTIRLDAVAVHKVAAQAQAEIMKLNPNVKIDTTKLLPTIPRRAAGPHTAVVNADELPLRIHRVNYERL